MPKINNLELQIRLLDYEHNIEYNNHLKLSFNCDYLDNKQYLKIECCRSIDSLIKLFAKQGLEF